MDIQTSVVTNFGEKPYNRCLQCEHRCEKRCDGPRTSAMTLNRWCEYMRLMKEANKLSNQEVAEKSKVSIKTIERIMAQNCDHDIMRETARLIEDAIIGSSNQYPCYLAFEEINDKQSDTLLRLERALEDNREYQEIIRNIHESYKVEMQAIRDTAQACMDDMRSQNERLKRNNDYLWEENNRKSKMIDTLIAQQTVLLEKK